MQLRSVMNRSRKITHKQAAVDVCVVVPDIDIFFSSKQKKTATRIIFGIFIRDEYECINLRPGLRSLLQSEGVCGHSIDTAVL